MIRVTDNHPYLSNDIISGRIIIEMNARKRMQVAVKVRFFSYLREAVGSSVISITHLSFPCQFGDVIQYLIHQHPTVQPYLIPETEVFRDELHVIVNGQSINEKTRDVLSYPIKDGDEIVILPPIGGGR